MLRRVLFFAILILPVISSAQDSSRFYKNQIKLSPLRTFDLFNPGIEISYERLYSKRFSTQLSYTFQKDVFGKSPYDNFHGYRLSIEEKYFFQSRGKSRKYVSVDLIGNNSKFNDETSFRDSVNNQIVFEQFSIHRKTFSANLKYGKQIFYNRFIIDWCVGAGIKFRNVTHQNRNHPMNVTKDPNLFDSAENEGKSITFNLPLNIKIGYVF